MEAKTTRANRVKSTSLVGPIVDGYYDDIRRAPQEGRSVCWFTGLPVFQILRAMDIAIVHTDGWAAGSAARRAEKELFDAAEGDGFSRDVCSYLRMNYGNAVIGQNGTAATVSHPEWIMPLPNLLVYVHSGCQLHENWLQAISRRLKVPTFFADQPYVWSEKDSDEAARKLTRNLRDLVTFVEDYTHRPYDWARLQELVANTKKSAILRMEALNLCKAIPSPASFFDWLICLAPINFLLGMPISYEYFEKFKSELEERVKQGIGVVPNEKYRLHWEGITVWNKVGWLSEKLTNLGACAVLGRYPHYGFYAEPERIDPEHPLESLADFCVRFHLNRSLNWQINHTLKLCKEFSIDGMLFQATRTCRTFAYSQLELMDAVWKQGMPAAMFEADHTDITYYSDAQIDTRLQGLLETIETQKRG